MNPGLQTGSPPRQLRTNPVAEILNVLVCINAGREGRDDAALNPEGLMSEIRERCARSYRRSVVETRPKPEHRNTQRQFKAKIFSRAGAVLRARSSGRRSRRWRSRRRLTKRRGRGGRWEPC